MNEISVGFHLANIINTRGFLQPHKIETKMTYHKALTIPKPFTQS